jgi:PAS domain-containing protein
LVSPQDRVRVREELSNILKRADYYSSEFSVIWPDGTIHWLLGKGQVFRDSRGNPIRLIGVNMDITERKRAEASLSESEERFRTMADTAPVMIWVAGPDKLWTFVNKTCLDFTGHTRSQTRQRLDRGHSSGRPGAVPGQVLFCVRRPPGVPG